MVEEFEKSILKGRKASKLGIGFLSELLAAWYWLLPKRIKEEEVRDGQRFILSLANL